MSKNYTPKNELELQYEREHKRILQAIRRQEKLGYIVPEDVRPKSPAKTKNITATEVENLIKLTPKEIRKKSVWVDQDTGEAFDELDVVNSHHKAKPSTAQVSGVKIAEPKKITEPKQRKPRKKKKKKTPPKTTTQQTQNLPTEEPEELDTFWYGDDLEDVPQQHRTYYPGFENIAITGYLKQLQQFPNAEGARMLSEWLTKLINEFGRHAVAVMLDEGSREGNIVTWETVYKGGVQVYMTNMMEYLPGIGETEKLRLGEIMEEMESWESPI